MTQTAKLELTPDEAAAGAAMTMPTADAIAALRREPRFKLSLAGIAGDNLKYYQSRWLANRVLNDRARFGMALLSMYLHFSYRPDVANSGLTAERFRDICVQAGLCGGGRVEGMLLVMRATGFLERADGKDSVRRYVATPKLINLHRERNRRLLWAVDNLRGGEPFADRIGDEGQDGFYAHFVRAVGRVFLAGYRMINSAPELRKIADRDAGVPMLMCALLATADYVDLVPEELRPVTVPDLALRLNVSRMHVRSLQRDAESAGLLIRHGDAGQATILPPLINALENFFASAFVMIEICAHAAAAEERRALIPPASNRAASLQPSSS